LQTQNDRTTFDTFEVAGTCADLYINGEYVTEASWADDLDGYPLAYLLPVFPEDYASAGEVKLQLMYSYYNTLNGTDQLAGETFTGSEFTYNAETETILLAEFSIPLP